MAPRGDTKISEAVVDPSGSAAVACPTLSIADTVIQVDDKLYSAQKLAEVHPGGIDLNVPSSLPIAPRLLSLSDVLCHALLFMLQ